MCGLLVRAVETQGKLRKSAALKIQKLKICEHSVQGSTDIGRGWLEIADSAQQEFVFAHPLTIKFFATISIITV